jgi:hypothetical protein
MRRILLATTAAAALIAGSSLVMAQQSGGANVGASGGANVQQHQDGTGGNAGVRGNAGTQGNVGTRGMTQNGAQGRGEHMGQANENRGQRMGERREERGNARGEERNERLGTRDRDRDMNRNARGDRDRDQRMGTRDRDQRLGTRDRGERRLGERDRGVREGRGEYGEIRDHVTTRLSSDQRTRIHERLFAEGGRGHRLGHVDFALRRGVRVPHSVEFFDLPEDIVTLVPAYRAYKYFLVGDEIVIVDPVTYEIVDVIPA